MLELLEDILDARVDAELQCRWVTVGLLDGEDKCVSSRFCLLSRSRYTLLDEVLLLFFVERLPLLKLDLMLCDAVCLRRHMGERHLKPFTVDAVVLRQRNDREVVHRGEALAVLKSSACKCWKVQI
ncbi:hypothetical protein V7S43_016864 [Phytophthora oleae]|uniref:Uncharacterized protein n=1 Tax=Phytophthora oleae TaxID=2107226 RepID=A0ABD3EV86_9STRA